MVIFRCWSFAAFSGSLILVGGDPGVGKSTLLLQVVLILCVLFIEVLLGHNQGQNYCSSFVLERMSGSFLKLLLS